jgi:hypothetical protein
MDLRDYPRPKGDTGIGVHWNAGFPAALGLGQIRDTWLPELIALGVKWVKISRHDGGLEFAELLLKHDIMPIVRLYRPQPNPGVLDAEALEFARRYVAAGVRYLEFNNEPELGVEWRNGVVPPDAMTIVARNAIVDMEALLKLGAYPGLPALAVGTKWDLVGEICRLGRRDLLAEPVWQALHNYSLNHPLDYPLDRANQEGAAVAQDLYDRLAMESWGGDAWGGWSLERINQERRAHANPGAAAFDDPSCWRAYERYDQLIRSQIGRSLPILATENGYVVGERPDPRYPATTPQLHAAQTLEACRAMMGTSTRFDHAPDYYFCTAFWLLGNYILGHWAPEWEGQAWYSGRWPGGQLPIVAALKAEAKQPRPWRGDGGVAGRVNGVLRNGGGATVQLTRPGWWTLTANTGADGRYEFVDLPLEQYTVTVLEANRTQTVALTRERPAAAANFDLTGITIRAERGVLRGTVRGGAGMIVRLARPADGWTAEQALAGDGVYRFERLAAGTYVLALAGVDVAQAGIALDGLSEQIVDLAAPGWGWQVEDGGPGPGFGVVRCRVKGRSDQAVRLWTVGWAGLSQRTGGKPEYGLDVCEFAPLGAGTYCVQPDGVEARAEAVVDGGRVVWVTFTESSAQPAHGSVIAGRVKHGAGRRLTLTGPEGEQTVTLPADGAYRFADLRPGIYRLAVAGTDAAQDGIVLDGRNRATVDLELPPPAAGAIYGVVAHGANRAVRLLSEGAEGSAQAQADAAGRYRFEGLGPGRYTVQALEVAPATGVAVEQRGVVVDGLAAVEVNLALPAPPPSQQWAVEDGGPGPGFSVVRCRVSGQPGRPVRLWTSGWDGVTQTTGSKPEYGADACEFAPLGAGLYWVQPQDLGVRAEVRVEPNRVAWVRFGAADPAPQPPTPPPAPPTPPPAPPPAPPKSSAIEGQVTGGDGQADGLLVTLAGPGGPYQAVVSEGRYRFAGLAAGTYRVAVLAADPALGELAVRDGIAVDGVQAVSVDLALPAPAPSASVVRGRVREGAGRPIRLEGAGLRLAATIAEDETYAFTGLPAGDYTLTVSDTEPPTGRTQTQGGILLDGQNTVTVDLSLDALGPGKTLEHYLLVGAVMRTKEDFLAVLRYVERFDPVVGSDEAEARQARHVTILGGVSAISALVEQGLRLSGCQVQRIEGDYAVRLGELLQRGKAY